MFSTVVANASIIQNDELCLKQDPIIIVCHGADGTLLNLLNNTLLFDSNAEMITFWGGKVKRQGHTAKKDMEYDIWPGFASPCAFV